MSIKSLSLAALLATVAFAAPQTYKVDKSHTVIGFEVSHLTLSETEGRFKNFDGSVTWDEANPTASKMDMTIQVNSINTEDEGRDKHLNSPDFFNSAVHPTIQFNSSKIVNKGKGAFEAIGSLTMLGVTKTVTIPFRVSKEVQHPFNPKQFVRAFKGSLTVKRSDFKLAPSTPGAVVGDEVNVKINGEFVR